MNMKTHTLRLTAMLLFMALCVAAGAATDKGKGMVSLTLTDEPLPSALKKIERQGGKSILFTYGETERYRVTAAIRGKTQAEAIAAVLDGKPFSFVERDIGHLLRRAVQRRQGKDGKGDGPCYRR